MRIHLNNLSCSHLIEIFQPTGRIFKSFHPCGSCKILDDRIYGIPEFNEIKNDLEELESKRKDRNVSSL